MKLLTKPMIKLLQNYANVDDGNEDDERKRRYSSGEN